MPAQHVVGAERDDHAVGLVRHRPVEPGEPVGGGVAGHPGIGDLGRNALGLERRLQAGPETPVRRQPEPGGERIAQRHDPHRPLLRRGRCREAKSPQIAAITTHPGPGAPNSHMSGAPVSRAARRRPADPRHERQLARGNGAAIALSGVNLSLGRGAARVHILKDIDLNIGRGEAIGMVGPSGSGKSTLLMVMAGLERPDTGSVTIAGEALDALGEDALARFRGRNVGIVFQSFHLIPTMTALENVAVPLELAGASDAHERAGAGARRRRTVRARATTIRRNCRAASSSASRWRARSRPIPRS